MQVVAYRVFGPKSLPCRVILVLQAFVRISFESQRGPMTLPEEVWLTDWSFFRATVLFHVSNTRWVTHSPTLGKNNAPLLLFTWKMFLLTDLTNIYVLESISSQILTYFSLILCLWNHTMCVRCFALTCKLKWDFDYNSSCFYRVGVVKGAIIIRISFQFAR